jgi:hypothetical protein
MTRPGRLAAAIAAVPLAALLAAGCASPSAPAPPSTNAAPASPLLNTSLQTAAGTWAAVVMGGSAASYDNFWQLFIRPVGSSRWKLVTPPGTADNGGLVLAATAGQPLVTGFRPSQTLTYTPLIQTSNGGRAWTSLNPLDAALASAPDALAIKPGSGELLALTAGAAQETAPGYATWTTLASRQALAATAAGRRCGLQALTAAAFGPSGTPMLAGPCARPGITGIFTQADGTWQAAGPAVPSALAGQQITVVRLTRTEQDIAALLTAGSGSSASLLAAWSADGTHWALSLPLPLHGTTVTSASFGPAGTAAVIAGNQGQIITGPGARWQPLPPLPAGTAALAPGPGGAADALAVHRGTLTIWQLPPRGTTWARAQVINVPIPYGSSS